VLPTQDSNHVTEGLGLVTSRYSTAAVVKGIITALLNKIQFIENSYWSLIDIVQLANHPQAGGPWDALDKLGSIVGGAAANRNGHTDADYLAIIKLQAKANRSRGRSEDVLSFGSLMINGGNPLYVEIFPAAFWVGCWNVQANYPLFVPLLTQVRAAGVYGILLFSTWPDGNDFEWGSRYDANAGQKGWGSRYDSTAGGVLVAATLL
jgi:hypothetical protein